VEVKLPISGSNRLQIEMKHARHVPSCMLIDAVKIEIKDTPFQILKVRNK